MRTLLLLTILVCAGKRNGPNGCYPPGPFLFSQSLDARHRTNHLSKSGSIPLSSVSRHGTHRPRTLYCNIQIIHPPYVDTAHHSPMGAVTDTGRTLDVMLDFFLAFGFCVVCFTILDIKMHKFMLWRIQSDCHAHFSIHFYHCCLLEQHVLKCHISRPSLT